MKPVCFMVMPFRRKPVTQARPGAPQEIDCDRLWDAALRPTLEELGYLPVRADIDPGAVIVKDMLNRLKHADLVVADISLPNGNVYYELGIRHVAKDSRCVVIAADWFQPLFDVDYIRTIVYPMPSGSVSDDEAAAIRKVLLEQMPRYNDTRTPYYELVDETAEQAFQDSAEQLSAFQAEIQEVRLSPPGDGRRARVKQLVKKHAATAALVPEVALELLSLVRDISDWQAVREFVEALPEQARRGETLQEQYLLAMSELGEHAQAIAGLEQLNHRFGATPERCGIIGGRYKRLYRDARSERETAGEPQPRPDERRYLKQAIEYYEQGMMLDLNEYYCACNLPALLRARGKRGDSDRASAIDSQVTMACRRAERRGSTDEWLQDTLFGTAFRGGDVASLEDIVEEIEGGVAWRLGSTLRDAEHWIRDAPEDLHGELEDILQRLRAAHAAAG